MPSSNSLLALLPQTAFPRLGGLLAALLVAVALISPAGAKEDQDPPAQDVADLFAEGEPAFDEEQVKKIVAEVVPLVEEVTGRKFKKIPEVKLAGRPEVASALALDIGPQLQRLDPNLGFFRTANMALASSKALAPALLGKYGFHKKILYLLPRNFDSLLRLSKIGPEHRDAVLKLITAHELAHALQDQQVDLLGVLEKIKTVERSQAANATIEGHAVFVQDAVGRKLGLDDAVVASARLFSAGVVQLADPAQQLMARSISQRFEVIYLGGRDFIAHHFAAGGNDRVWEIMAKPPADTTMILQPERYSPDTTPEINYAEVMKGVELLFGDVLWNATHARIGQLALSGVYASMNAEDRDVIVRNLVAAHAVIARREEKLISVSVMDFQTPEIALRMLEAVKVMAKDNVEKLKNSPSVKIDGFLVEDFPSEGNDAGHKIQFTVTPQGSAAVPQTFVRIIRDRYVIEFHDSSVGLPEEKFHEIANHLLARVMAAQEKLEGEQE